MAIVEITPPPAGVYSWRVPFRLDGIGGSLIWRWNAVVPCWVIDVLDASGVKLFGPIPLAPGDDLFEGWRHFEIPPGQLRVEFVDGAPGLRDFDNGARLVYETVG